MCVIVLLHWLTKCDMVLLHCLTMCAIVVSHWPTVCHGIIELAGHVSYYVTLVDYLYYLTGLCVLSCYFTG